MGAWSPTPGRRGPVAPPLARGWPCSRCRCVGLALLLAVPELDLQWEHQPSHFWIVLRQRGAERRPRLRHERRRRPAPRRPGDPRLARVPRRRRVPRPACARDARRAAPRPEHRVRDRDTGRADDRVGLRGGVGHRARRARARPAVLRWRGALLVLTVAAIVGWGVVSLAGLPPLDGPLPCARRARVPGGADDRRRGARTAGRRGACWTCIAHGQVPCRCRSPWASCCSPRRWSPSRSAATGTSRGGSGTC